jgi:hypothetical protein
MECEAGEKMSFGAVHSGEVSLNFFGPIPCTNDFLVRNLRPGTYSFQLQKDTPAPAKWALASVDISSKNIEVVLTLEPEAQIVGRVVAADGVILPPLDKTKVSTRSAGSGPSPATPDTEGKFVLTNLKFPQHQIIVAGLTKDYYVKEIRLGGAPVPDATVTLSPGAVNQVEILIDDKPETISGTVTDGDKPAARAEVRLYPKAPPSPDLPLEYSASSVRTDREGKFQINGLTPGEYRIVAWQPPPTGSAGVLMPLAAHAQSINVERGGTATVTLPLSDPLH